MSHHSEENLMQPCSDSFWEVGNYKRTAKRIEDGYKLCSDLQTLVQERAEIEKTYAKSLKAWSKKWTELIEKGPEYGTMEAAWKSSLIEADRISDVHIHMKENLYNDVIFQIKAWQKDNYHKTMIHMKERKEMEDAFKKAQKPWAKYLSKVEKCKSDYHSACKAEKTALNQERNANSDSTLSGDQIKKLQDRVQRAKEDVQKCKDKYEQALQDLNKYNPIYIEDMKSVFTKCQEMEETRLKFFKEALFSIHKCLNISQEQSLPQIYEEFYHTINNADAQKDLKWWSNNHGVNMPMAFPEYVEYTEEFREIAKGIKSKDALPNTPIQLINQRTVTDDLHDYPPPNSKNNPSSSSFSSVNKKKPNDVSKTTSSDKASPKTESPPNNSSQEIQQKSPQNSSESSSPNRNSTITNGTNSKSEPNPFEEEDWDEGDGTENVLVDNGEPGVPVKALYDYVGAENDELSFKQGEIFEKLEDEDEQGWCKGRKNGRVGLYPANYVELVP